MEGVLSVGRAGTVGGRGSPVSVGRAGTVGGQG